MVSVAASACFASSNLASPGFSYFLTLDRKHQMKTVGDIVDLIHLNLNSKDPELAAHAATLRGPRTHGTTTRIGLEKVSPYIYVHLCDAHPAVEDGCDLYRFRFDMGAETGAIRLAVTLAAGMTVEIVEGLHGKELQGPREHDLWKVRSPYLTEIYIIVGERKGERAVFTWHPDHPLKPFKGLLDPHVAVKRAKA